MQHPDVVEVVRKAQQFCEENELKECEKNMWKKESHEPSALYVDLFKATLMDPELTGFISAGKSNAIADNHRIAGNQLFVQQKWSEALDKYNDSLRYAEFGSESLSFAYANRSSCFLHLEKYDDCLADIESAIKANYPARLMAKLEQRKAECMAKRAQDPITKRKPELSYPPK